MKLRKILVVSCAFPSRFEAAVYGLYQRLRIFLEAAASVTKQLDILFFVDPAFLERFDDDSFAADLSAHWGIDARVRLSPREVRQRRWTTANFGPIWDPRHHYSLYQTCGVDQCRAVESSIERDTDLVIAFQLASVLPVLAVRDVLAPVALDLNDIMHLAVSRMIARPPRKPFEYLYQPALFLGERNAIRRSQVAFVCSETARRYLERFAGDTPLKVAPNAVAYSAAGIRRPTHTSRNLLFVGMYAYPPNLEAAEWLVRVIFPLVLRRAPDARLMLVGGHIETLMHLDGVVSNVDFLGFVPDITEIYGRSAISCSPILAGGGTRTKIIEAAAYGVPVVSTTLGAEGLDFVPEREILLRDDAGSFANACVELLNDPVRARGIAERALDRASTYDRARVIPKLAADLVAAAHRSQ